MNTETPATKNLTIMLIAGRLPQNILQKVGELGERFGFGAYLTTMQNLRLTGVREGDLETIKTELAALGAAFKAPGIFPKPRVCVGTDGCNLALVDTKAIACSIQERFGKRAGIKPKLKMNIAACPASCSNAHLADIGVVATKAGYDIYAGGKGGPFPKNGRRIVRGADEGKVLEVIETLVDFHQSKTPTKQRMAKLMDDQDFPFAENE